MVHQDLRAYPTRMPSGLAQTADNMPNRKRPPSASLEICFVLLPYKRQWEKRVYILKCRRGREGSSSLPHGNPSSSLIPGKHQISTAALRCPACMLTLSCTHCISAVMSCIRGMVTREKEQVLQGLLNTALLPISQLGTFR